MAKIHKKLSKRARDPSLPPSSMCPALKRRMMRSVQTGSLSIDGMPYEGTYAYNGDDDFSLSGCI